MASFPVANGMRTQSAANAAATGSLGAPAVRVNKVPAGAPTPTGGWRCVLADGFNVARPYSGILAPNRHNDAGDNGLVADCGGFNVNEVAVFNAGQVIPMADGMHLRATWSPQHVSPAGSFLEGTGTLGTALTTAGAITSLTVAGTGLGGGSGNFGGLASGASFLVIDPTAQHSQVWTLSAAAAGGATTLAVTSQTPNFAYPVGSWVSAVNYVCGCMSSQPSNPIAGSVGFPVTGFRFLPLAGITFAFEIVVSLPVADNPGGDMAFWAASPTSSNEIDFMEWTDYTSHVGGGIWATQGAWFDHVHSLASSGEAFSNATPALTAQIDGVTHRWTSELRAADSTVHTYLDGVELTAMAYNWPASWNTANTDFLHLFLSHGLRNAFTGQGPTFTTFTDVVVRSIAVYQDVPHAGQNVFGGGTALGTVLA